MTLWNVESWTVEPHGVYFVARQLVTDGVANHENNTIETQVKNLVEDTIKTQVELSLYTHLTLPTKRIV